MPQSQKSAADSETKSNISRTSENPCGVLKDLSKPRKTLLLIIFCLAFFLDTMNNSFLFSAIPPIAVDLDMANSESVWLLSAYQLTFAALLLVSGRLSDLYNPKWVFISGAGGMGVFALIAGFIRSKIPLIVLRALMGAGGALTVPSAMHLIVHMYPDPAEQAKAVTVFGAMGAIGMVVGLLIGAAIVSRASWPWIFYVSAIISAIVTVSFFVLVPSIRRTKEDTSVETRLRRLRRLDPVGVFIFAATLILFIFAITSGSIDGWGSAKVIAPLVISAVLAVLFFLWEAKLPADDAALPPHIWRYENFKILIIVSLVPYMWWGSIFPLFSWLYELVYGWSAINVAVHFLPIGLGMFPVLPLAASLQSKIRLKWVILLGLILLLGGTILLPFADSKEKYWRFAFPGFLLGTAGAALTFLTLNIAILATTPAEVSGIVQAVFTSVLQTAGATGVAIVTSIQTSVQITHGGPTGFAGRAAGLWFIVAFAGLIAVLCFGFMKDTVPPIDPNGPPIHLVEEKQVNDSSV